MQMLSEPYLAESFPVDWDSDLEEFLAGIAEHGRIYEKNPMGFDTIAAHNYHTLCAQGKVGMSKILKTTRDGISGWLQYKTDRYLRHGDQKHI